MHTYIVSFSVNGRRSETTVSAISPIQAKELVNAQYRGSKVTIWNVKQSR